MRTTQHLDFEAARAAARALGTAAARTSETVAVADALWRTLAEPVASLAALPSHTSSAMDGWAVAGPPPWVLIGQRRAGDEHPAEPLRPGTALGITTGGSIPAGTHGVLRSEHGQVHDGMLRRGERARPDEPRAGEHVRPLGEESAAGEILLPAGSLLTPPRLSLAAMAGNDSLTVAHAPSADVLVLGSEIVRLGLPGGGLVRDTHGPALPGMLATLGAVAGPPGLVGDDAAETIRAVEASDAALLVTTGGTAGSPADHARTALRELGAELVIDGVAMRPGHPVLLARRADGRAILCLPGNPLAAILSFAAIATPLLDGMLGREPAPLGGITLGEAIPPRAGTTRLLAYRLVGGDARLCDRQHSGMLRGLATADGVIVAPPAGLPAGATAQTLALPW